MIVIITIIVAIYIALLASSPFIFNYASIDGLKNLYTIISSISTCIIGLFGIIL